MSNSIESRLINFKAMALRLKDDISKLPDGKAFHVEMLMNEAESAIGHGIDIAMGIYFRAHGLVDEFAKKDKATK